MRAHPEALIVHGTAVVGARTRHEPGARRAVAAGVQAEPCRGVVSGHGTWDRMALVAKARDARGLA